MSLVPLFGTQTAVAAELPLGTKQILLHPGEGDPITVGTATFSGTGAERKIQVTMKDGLFKDHFLSMRPFKCLEGSGAYYCYLPYPYENRLAVTAEDLVDLEYQLLFIRKQPSEYGINMWNGVYYRLKLEEGGKITGKLHEVDMDILASPPPAGEFRPIGPGDIELGIPSSHWLPTVTIE